MPRVLLFLPLLLLGPAVALSDVDASDRVLLRALLAELAGPIPPQARGVPCHDLGPNALPGFARLPPEPHALARAALALALNGAGCGAQAEAEALGLARELGTPTAAALLRGLAGLRGAPAPQPLSLLLLSLARPGGSACVDPTPLRTPGARPTAPWAGRVAGARLPPCQRLSRRRRQDEGEAEDACNPPGEREAHRVLEWVPGVSIFYNLGTSIYFAFQGCGAAASARALEATEDLGYAGLAALTGSLGGPVAVGVQMGLQPGLKAGVRALIGYFTSAGDPPPVPTAHSGSAIIV
ncbi:apolipoprotein F-like [Neopelma chrysocephalum]|uniref:apolipoprotein F-like n=1 Tax=Neopelma chrysocephalum TaxID=114329 RepID=UPI000FCD2DBB|nr:apolipoprotein F-like [Neopelma chrysocephalum]